MNYDDSFYAAFSSLRLCRLLLFLPKCDIIQHVKLSQDVIKLAIVEQKDAGRQYAAVNYNSRGQRNPFQTDGK